MRLIHLMRLYLSLSMISGNFRVAQFRQDRSWFNIMCFRVLDQSVRQEKGSNCFIVLTPNFQSRDLLECLSSLSLKQNSSKMMKQQIDPIFSTVSLNLVLFFITGSVAMLKFQGWYKIQQQNIFTPNPSPISILDCQALIYQRHPNLEENSSLFIYIWERQSEGGKPFLVAENTKNQSISLVMVDSLNFYEIQQSICIIYLCISMLGNFNVFSRIVIQLINSSFKYFQQYPLIILSMKTKRFLQHFYALLLRFSSAVFLSFIKQFMNTTAQTHLRNFLLTRLSSALLLTFGNLRKLPQPTKSLELSRLFLFSSQNYLSNLISSSMGR